MIWFMLTVAVLSVALVAIVEAAFLAVYLHERQTVQPRPAVSPALRRDPGNHPHRSV